MPPVIGAPLPRVSTIRQGGRPMNGSGGVASERVRAPAARVGDQVAGEGQFVMTSPPKARPARESEIKHRNETLRVSIEHLLALQTDGRHPEEKRTKGQIDGPSPPLSQT